MVLAGTEAIEEQQKDPLRARDGISIANETSAGAAVLHAVQNGRHAVGSTDLPDPGMSSGHIATSLSISVDSGLGFEHIACDDMLIAKFWF